MTPEQAKAEYEAQWPALNEAKNKAIAKGDRAAAKRARQQLSALSNRYRERNAVDDPGPDDPPAWHDAPTCAGLWLNSISGRANIVIDETLHAWQDSGAMYFGPMPGMPGMPRMPGGQAMKIKASLTITRSSENDMNIRIMDTASRAQFVRLTLSPESLMLALNGLAHVEVDAEVNHLSVVGMARVIEDRKIVCPLPIGTDKDTLKAWLLENASEDGWIIDLYLGSRGSVSFEDGKTVLRYKVYRYESGDKT